MRPGVAAVLVSISVVAPCAGAHGQSVERLTPGARVRVRTAAARPVTGTIVNVGQSAFGFRPEKGSDTIYVEYGKVERIDLSQGRKHRVLRDAIYGGIAGVVIGGVIGAASHPNFPSSDVVVPPDDSGADDGCTIREPECANPEPTPQEPTIIYREPTGADLGRTARSAAIGAAAGAIVGAVVGRLTTSEVWKKLPLVGDRVRVTLQPDLMDRRDITLGFAMALR